MKYKKRKFVICLLPRSNLSDGIFVAKEYKVCLEDLSFLQDIVSKHAACR